MDRYELTLVKIKEAWQRITPFVHQTPLQHSRTLSEIANCQAYLKLENMQKTGSFKIRGAVNKIFTLSPEKMACGVLSASAGNHAQGVAWAAKACQVSATIVMPEKAPAAKVRATKAYGANVVLCGQNYDEAYRYACELQQEQNSTFIHAFDDQEIIAGQGTIALEILSQLYDVDAIIAPVGGGGLIAGLAVAAKEHNPKIRIIGVQAAGAPSMAQSLACGVCSCLPSVKTIADGIAVKQPGNITFHYTQKYVDELILVTEEELIGGILFMLERGKVMTEGAGIAGIAALLAGKIELPGQKVAVVVSGGNMDPLLLSLLIEDKYQQVANW
ncbi:threonine ammonia-lyase [Sporomusa acidovorans]|uniref:L-threonine dehydratase catabolic TdcB n=1 Tax=Sporomusa acidovorans (strain ATCC 49682 / DSM 3132 / Mol) TaxID=1123286 RepID=A0ABZ3J7T8_SPOA4|nr:threonine ammonia-lyase [Sporomusa acidovorans]OZC16736.1 L-threonine dehydratase catabolic TdcB [Sporomusa acidovorans DSM 3132]SDE04184.1 threonine dehydratase [Sporomusa acidovorans]